MKFRRRPDPENNFMRKKKPCQDNPEKTRKTHQPQVGLRPPGGPKFAEKHGKQENQPTFGMIWGRLGGHSWTVVVRLFRKIPKIEKKQK